MMSKIIRIKEAGIDRRDVQISAMYDMLTEELVETSIMERRQERSCSSTTALLDWLLYNTKYFSLKGESYRIKHPKEKNCLTFTAARAVLFVNKGLK